MNLASLLLLFIASAVVVHLARYWRPLAFMASIGVTVVLWLAVRDATAQSVDLLGVSFALQPLARDYLMTAVVLSGILAVAISLTDTRRALGFIYWSWIPWLAALTVNEFVIGVFAWATGLAAMVIAMEPRRAQRVGGAAYFLVLVIVASALLLIGNRFVQLYPLTPDQISLIESAVLFLTWGLGILLAVVPFSLWLGPLADETPLPILAVLLGLGQPIGLWLLYGLIGQYPRLLELSNLLAILAYGGIAAIAVGGALSALERRAARLMSFSALFALGFVLLDLSRGSLEGTTYAVVETFARAFGLTLMAASITLARALKRRWVDSIAIAVFLLGALALAGIAPGIALATRWNLLTELEATEPRLFYLAMLATLGVLIGAARFVMLWLERISPAKAPTAPLPATTDVEKSAGLASRARAGLRSAMSRASPRVRLPPLAQRGARIVYHEWRAIAALGLLVALGLGMLLYGASPNVWFERALETTQQLLFVR